MSAFDWVVMAFGLLAHFGACKSPNVGEVTWRTCTSWMLVLLLIRH